MRQLYCAARGPHRPIRAVVANRRHPDIPKCSQAHGTGAMGSWAGGGGAVWGYAGADAWPKLSRVDSTCSKKHQSEPARAAEANRRHPGISGCSLPHGIATLGAVGVMGALWALPALWPLKVVFPRGSPTRAGYQYYHPRTPPPIILRPILRPIFAVGSENPDPRVAPDRRETARAID